jgi:hypothetical protein
MRTCIETITPEMAADYLLRNKSNRKVSWHHVDSLCRAMISDKFDLTHQGIAFDERGYLIDGQHRLHAIIKANKPVRISVTYGVGGESRISIDTQMRPRSYADALTIEGDDLATKQTIAACRMWMLLNGNSKPALFEVREFLARHRESIRLAVEIAAGNSILNHGSILGMLVIAVEAGHAEEIRNWAEAVKTGVAREDWQTSATRFREWWLSSPKSGGSSTRCEYCRRIFASMDAWINRRGLSKLYARESIDWIKQLQS